MSSFPDESRSPWSNTTIPTGIPTEPSVESALEKERVIKDIISLRDGLRGFMLRVTEVEGETDRLKRDNEMLRIYIVNLYVPYEIFPQIQIQTLRAMPDRDCTYRTRNSVVAAGTKR